MINVFLKYAASSILPATLKSNAGLDLNEPFGSLLFLDDLSKIC
jgi:hypothetical protein